MKRVGVLLADISEKAVIIIALLFLGVLAIWVGQDTYGYPWDYSYEILIWMQDNLFRQLLMAVAVMAAFGVLARFLFHGKDEAQKRSIVKWWAVAEMLLVGILLTVWVSVTRFSQSRDAAQVFYIAGQFSIGDYEYMNSAYIQGFQQQLGLVFLDELMLMVWPDVRFFQYLNVLFIVGILFFLYRITDMLFHNQIVNFYCLVGSGMFLPMHFYVNLAYGDICSISLSLMAIWALMRWNETGKKRYVAIAAAGIAISMLARKNTLIILIAIVICLILDAWKKWNWRPVAVALLVTGISFAGMNLVAQYYEHRSGVELGDSMPAILWIAMGMRGEPGAYGTYNGYHESVFWGTGGNVEESSQIAWTHIRERIGQFVDDPRVAYDFYKNKLLQQWGENTYGSMILTVDKERYGEKLVEKVYFSEITTILKDYMNYYTFLLYLGVFLYAAEHLRRKRGIWHCLLLILIIGGILFSLLWENKSRYVLPYVICMIPYTSYGIWEIQDKAAGIIRRFLSDRKTA